MLRAPGRGFDQLAETQPAIKLRAAREPARERVPDRRAAHPRSRDACPVAAPKEDPMLGLVLTAGGARGAYQAGVLSVSAELPGAVRAAFAVRDGRRRFGRRDQRLAPGGARRALRRGRPGDRARLVEPARRGRLPQRRPQPRAAGRLARLRLRARRRSLGRTRTHGLFDTTPLAQLLERRFPPRGIADAHPSRPALRRRGHRHELPLGPLLHLRPGPAGSPGLGEEPARGAAGDADRIDT